MSERVCLVGPVFPYRGGIAHYTSMLAREFANDHVVLVVNFKRLYPSLLFPGKTQFDESGEPLALDSIRVIDSINPISFWRAARAIRDFHPDRVVFQWWHPFFAVAYATIVAFLPDSIKGRVVYLCHNVMPHESSLADRVLIRLGFRGVDRFLVQSREDRGHLLAIKERAKVVVHPHPIYDTFKRGKYTSDKARRELRVDGPVVLFFGLIRPYKGLKVLIDAFAEVIARLQASLWIVGEFYEDKRPYVARVKQLKLTDNVKIIDQYVPNEDVEKYFVAADLVVLPYLSATQSGITQIAFAFDKPVVVTAVGGLPDVVDDGVTGFVVPPRDPEALCHAILEFFEKEHAARMRDAISRTKHRFSWGRCRELLLELGGNGGS